MSRESAIRAMNDRLDLDAQIEATSDLLWALNRHETDETSTEWYNQPNPEYDVRYGLGPDLPGEDEFPDLADELRKARQQAELQRQHLESLTQTRPTPPALTSWFSRTKLID